MGNMIKDWVVFNKLEDFNSLLKYIDDDFTSTGKFCYINENAEKLHRKHMKDFYNLRWYIQHLVDENEYQYGDDEWINPLSESKWTYRTNKHFMKYVKFTLQQMTESHYLCDLWEHTIVKVVKHDSKSKLGIMFKQWIIFNKLEYFNSILNCPIDDFTTSGNMCYMNEHGDILPYTPMIKIFNL